MDTIASIEIGTNSIRMLIAEKGKSDNPLRTVLRKRVITRLGENFSRDEISTLKPEAMSRSISVLDDFFGIASQFGISSPIVVATGVFRKAVNRNNFITLIAKRLGHNIKIISGKEEAELTCKGILSSLNHRRDPLIIFDLGGGSTEFIWANNKEGKSISMDLGVVTLTEDYLIADPPKNGEIHQLINHIEDTFKTRLDCLKETGRRRFSVVGTGGTLVNLAAMVHGIGVMDYNEKIDGLVIMKNEVVPLFEKMKKMPGAERLNLKGLESGREDIILAGTLIIIKIMDYFEKNEIIVSYSDLLEGMLLHYMEGEKNG
jgi:exopolyphosphatase/guanosine-5'-triphosphate,3'-diphosphate pyrophosphatase